MTIIYTCIAFAVAATVAVTIAYREGRIKGDDEGFARGYKVGLQDGERYTEEWFRAILASFGLGEFSDERGFRIKTRDQVAKEVEAELAERLKARPPNE